MTKRSFSYLLLFSFLLLPLAALAQAVTLPAGGAPVQQVTPPATSGWLTELLKALAVPLFTAAVALVTRLFQHETTKVAQTKAEIWEQRLLAAVAPVGAKIWSRAGAEIQNAILGGKIDGALFDKLKQIALEELTSYFGHDGMSEALSALGLPNPLGLVSMFLSHLVPTIGSAHDESDKTVPDSVKTLFPAPDVRSLRGP